MAQNASDSQKVDFLWKKIVYGAAKTDISGNIDATNEPNPSPLLIRGDKILQQASLIANVIPGSNSSVVTVYPTTFPIECINTAGIPTPTLTWQTGRTFWVPPEFGSTYQIKVYISPSGQAANVLTKGTQVFATGSGNNDLWVFDYQAGILNFNSNNTPYNASNQPISFTGNSVYISGAVYSGLFGLPDSANIGNLILGNITFTGNTISSNQANGNIMIFAPGQGIVQFVGQDAIGLPAGDDSTRPAGPYVGYIRFNTSRSDIEYWNGTTWTTPAAGIISSDTINPDGTSNTFVLSSNSSTLGVMVSINGTLQQPTTAYTIINNNQIQFTEIPLTTDIVEVRHIVPGSQTVSAESLTLGTTSIILDPANVNVTGNLLPSVTNTYDLGSNTLLWRGLYIAGNVNATNLSGTLQTSAQPNITSLGILTGITLNGGQINTNANTVITSNTTISIDSYNKTVYRTAKYIIQSTSSVDAESYEALVTHNGAGSAYITTYGVINTGNSLGNLSANVVGNTVNLNYTAYTTNANVRITKNYIIL